MNSISPEAFVLIFVSPKCSVLPDKYKSLKRLEALPKSYVISALGIILPPKFKLPFNVILPFNVVSPVKIRSEPSNVKLELLFTADVPFPVKIPCCVKFVEPVPPLPTGTVLPVSTCPDILK